MSPPAPIPQGEIIPATNAPPDLPKLLVAPTILEPSIEVPAPTPPPGITLLLSPDVPSAACSLSRCHFPRHCHPPLWNTLQPRPWANHSAGHQNGQGLCLSWAPGNSVLGGGSPAPVSLIPTMSQGPYGPPGDGSASPWLGVPTALPGTVLPSWHHWVQPAYTSSSDTILEPPASDPTLPMSPQERDWSTHSSLHLLSLSRLHMPQHTHIEGPCVRGAAPGGDTVCPMSGSAPAPTEGHVVCEGGPGAQ